MRKLLLRLLPALLALLAGCSRDAPYNFLHPEGPVARKADGLWDLTFGIATVIFFLVEGALLFIIVRYRYKRKTAELPKQTHGNTKLEVLWTLIPVLLLSGVAVPTVKGIVDMGTKPKDSLEIRVIGHQWWWEFQYGDSGVVTANELHIPVGTPVYLTLESVDVIHSFWIPKLAGKQDAIPGRINHMNILADRAGTYLGQCVEYCGLSHANMRVTLFAESQEDFDDWISGQQTEASSPIDALAIEGEKLFLEGACAGCHAIKGTDAQGNLGPNLTHMASRTKFAGAIFDTNASNLAMWLKDPPGVKPGSKMPNLQLRDEEIEALVAYLQSLK